MGLYLLYWVSFAAVRIYSVKLPLLLKQKWKVKVCGEGIVTREGKNLYNPIFVTYSCYDAFASLHQVKQYIV